MTTTTGDGRRMMTDRPNHHHRSRSAARIPPASSIDLSPRDATRDRARRSSETPPRVFPHPPLARRRRPRSIDIVRGRRRAVVVDDRSSTIDRDSARLGARDVGVRRRDDHRDTATREEKKNNRAAVRASEETRRARSHLAPKSDARGGAAPPLGRADGVCVPRFMVMSRDR